MSSGNVSPAKPANTEVLIYEYGARLDKECREAVGEQIIKARHLYNEIVACIRVIVAEMQAFVIEKAGPDAQAIQERITALSDAFVVAKAANNEEEMKCIAQERRPLWRELGDQLKGARKAHRVEIQERFLNRIGKKSTCDTYQIRCKAVADGLGWATATAILDAALIAFKKSFMLGRAPRFAIGADKDQDTLTLQFTEAGGVAADKLLAGKHSELKLALPYGGVGKRQYGSFSFRLGTAKAGTDASGTWQYHRTIPEGSHIGLARLIRRRVGKDYKWAIQLMVKPPEPVRVAVAKKRGPLVAVHFGWAFDVDGRRVAGIADSADPGAARIVRLPNEIEEGLNRSAALQSERDFKRDEIVPLLKELTVRDGLADEVRDELAAIRHLPVQHVAIRRLHRLCWMMLRDIAAMPDWLEAWRKDDRMLWQSAAHIARRARNARKGFYRQVALDLARNYSAIVIEPLDLAEAALKVDEATGEKTEFAKKARSGRVVAALYEFESAIRWAAAKGGAAVLELSGKTIQHCSMCGGTTLEEHGDSQMLHCTHCGAELDRKQNGAAMAWRYTSHDLEDVVAEYWIDVHRATADRKAEKHEKLTKMAAGRRNARGSSDCGVCLTMRERSCGDENDGSARTSRGAA